MVPKATNRPTSPLTNGQHPSSSTERDSSSDGFYYLTRDAQHKLKIYQYKGEDRSPTYKYILSPLAQWCVDHCVPRSVAPNTITLFGLLLMISAYLLFWWYVPTMTRSAYENDEEGGEEYPPRWIFLWNGICMLCYQTLDNMDGKQARRTNSSSPLGLLFDHGCDAINTIFGLANWIIGMGLDWSNPDLYDLQLALGLILGCYTVFYVATWEQYFTGELILPAFNAPNEGLIGGVILSWTSFWLGPQFWQGTGWYQGLISTIPLASRFIPVIRNCDFVMGAALFGYTQEVIIKTASVLYKYPQHRPHAIATLVPLFLLGSCSWTLIVLMIPDVFVEMPRTILHWLTLVFVELSTELMLGHVTQQAFDPWRRWSLWSLVGVTMYGLTVVGSETSTNTSIGYWITLAMAATATHFSFKTVLVIREICQTFRIWCFDVTTPYSKQPTLRQYKQR